MNKFHGSKIYGFVAAALFWAAVNAAPQAGATLHAVKERGAVRCGVSQGVPGFSDRDDQGNWSGLDVDTCRAVAAAVLGDAGKIELTPLSARDRFEALSSGKIDLLPRNTTWTLTRDTTLGLNFAGVNYYDGQGFLVPKELGVRSALELNQVTICALNGTTTELNLIDYFRTHRMEYKVVVFDTVKDLIAAYDKRQCDVYTSDQSQLHGQRLKLTNPDDHLVLPEVISKEPLGPVVRHGDDSWLDIVQWSLFCMVNAEELSVTSDNVDQTKADSKSPEIRRLLGVEGDIGKALGVSNDWCVNIIKQVGNYGEVFSRHLGTDTPLKIDRGLNALWSRGGLMYAPPAR